MLLLQSNLTSIIGGISIRFNDNSDVA